MTDKLQIVEPPQQPYPAWWDTLRRIATFVLGVVCIVWALFQHGQNIGTLTIGLVMVGVLPIENWFQFRR